MKKEAKQSVFMQMHNGTRTSEGSFNIALKDCFYRADMNNRRKLVKAFNEFFGDELPEFGITKEKDGKSGTTSQTFRYKGWLCEWNESRQIFILYTPDELEQPRGFRTEEFECETKEMCKQFIDSY